MMDKSPFIECDLERPEFLGFECTAIVAIKDYISWDRKFKM